jgi:prolyl oligopeptidase
VYFTTRDAFNVSVQRTSFTGGAATAVVLPILGSATLAPDNAHQRNGVLVGAESWTSAEHFYAWDAKTGEAQELALRNAGSFSAMPDVEVSNVEVRAADGAKVPLIIISRRGTALNGKNPTILYGYGSYGITINPAFVPTRYPWFEHGGIFAIAGVRGGGERGNDWHMGGYKASKPNTWKDGIACAEYLIGRHYTAPAYLAAQGGSAGGIFAGRIMTARPDLFRGAIVQVGMTDTLRSEFSANGATNSSEFGTVADPEGFKALLEMSTYQHVTDGTAYPAVLFAHGLNDPRVDVWMSVKSTARLQKATSSGRPVLLRLELQAGHGIGSTRLQRVAEQADIFAFLLWQMGDPGFQPAHR